MKNLLTKCRVLCFGVLSLCLFFSILNPRDSQAQTTVFTGTLYIYQSENDTLSVVATDGVIKFYALNNSGQMVLKATGTVDQNGVYTATVTGSEDIYVISFPSDPIEDDFVASYYPGWLDFESADAISPNGGVVDYDWGAVGKEIVERPVGAPFNISGRVNTSLPLSEDFSAMAYLMNGENVVTSTVVAKDGNYSLTAPGSGEYEVFVSVPGYSSQSTYVSSNASKTDIHNINFNLDVYRGESVTTPSAVIPESFTLNQNYPNPFNPSTNINFTLSSEGKVNLTVYNSLGKVVSNLVNDYMEAGSYSIQFNAQNLSSGVYYYTLKAGNNVITKKMNLIK